MLLLQVDVFLIETSSSDGDGGGCEAGQGTTGSRVLKTSTGGRIVTWQTLNGSLLLIWKTASEEVP